MDPGDETILKLQENSKYIAADHYVDLRLYETYEARERVAGLIRALREPTAKMKAKISDSMGVQELPKDKYLLSGLIRFTRFCDNIRVYSGSLDLTGRHQRRYEAHMRLFGSFVAEFWLAMRGTTRDVDRKGYFTSSPPSLLKDLRSRWRLSPYLSEGICAIQLSEALYAMANTEPKI